MHNITTRTLHPEGLPLVIEPTGKQFQLAEFLNHLQENTVQYRKKLLEHGGLLFRNFPVETPNDFVAVIKNLQLGEFCSYVGGDSPRKKVVDGVYTSTEAPPSIKLPLHNELSYVKNYPKHICFYCETPPAAKGETIIGDARKIYQAIDEEVKKRFIDKGLRYVSCYPYKSRFMNYVNKSHKSWINVFETEDKQEVERKCRENDISFNWNQNDWIKISQVCPAVIAHPETKEHVWFNQAHHFDFNPKFLGWWRYLGTKLLYSRKHTLLHEVFYGDDTKISRKDLYHIMDAMDKHTIYFPWQKGDVLVLDNILAMHGRETFTGKRRILTAMTS
ncbi:MAG: TauD/TfdA family dioxygenase [Verrucomicrobia bacterium]|nr:TauD/TfdA family dioxygenase [Verrucomicrobiota bacterium]